MIFHNSSLKPLLDQARHLLTFLPGIEEDDNGPHNIFEDLSQSIKFVIFISEFHMLIDLFLASSRLPDSYVGVI